MGPVLVCRWGGREVWGRMDERAASISRQRPRPVACHHEALARRERRFDKLDRPGGEHVLVEEVRFASELLDAVQGRQDGDALTVDIEAPCARRLPGWD